MTETDKEALECVISEELATIAAYNSTAQPGHHLTGRGIVQMLAVAVDAAGFTRQPQPHVVETVEELEALPVGTVIGSRLAGGEWSVATKNAMEDGWEDFDWTIDGHAGKCSRQGVVERMGFPLAVLTPVTQPTASEPTEAQVERVEGAVREAMESRQGGLVPLGGQAWGEPDDYWISMHVGPVARAALTAAAKVGGE